jgi:hypothetical protein
VLFVAVISNPQPNPQIALSCTTCRYFGSPRVVSCCKTTSRHAVTEEIASSSLVVPAILSYVSGRSLKNLHRFQ